MDNQSLIDEIAVTRVRQQWAFARDLGEWDTMRACFHPDATVHVSWFSGPCAKFFEATIAMSAARKPEERSKHWFGNSRAWVKGDRALAETDAMVMGRDKLEGHLFDFIWFTRMFDRVERRDGVWRIARMVVIYDKDRMDPVIAGSVPPSFFAGAALEGERSSIAMMSFRSAKMGRTVPADITIGGTAREREVRAEAEAWLKAG